MNRETLKNALEGLDPALTDEILEKRAGAETPAGKTGSAVVRVRRLALAAAAVLALSAVMIPVGLLTRRGGVALPDPVRISGSDPAEGRHSFVKNDYLTGLVPADQNEPKAEGSGEGMRAFRTGGKDLLALNCYGVLCDPASGEISRAGDVNNFTRYFTGGATDGKTVYFPGRFLGCVPDGSAEEHNGIYSCGTDFSEVSPVLLSDYGIRAVALHGGYLWFAEYSGSRHIVYRDENGGGGEWDIQTVNIYRADFETGEIRLMLDTGCWMYDETLIAADDGLWLAAVYIDPDDGGSDRYAVLHITYDGEYTLSPLPDPRACLCLCEGRIYAYSPYWLTSGDQDSGQVVPRTYLYLIRENAEPKLLFSDDTPFPGAARIVGADGDLPVIYRGKLVVFRGDRLCLYDLSTGRETEILSGLDLASRALTGDGGMFLPVFSKTVLDGKLYFRDIRDEEGSWGTVYVFDGGECVGKLVTKGGGQID